MMVERRRLVVSAVAQVDKLLVQRLGAIHDARDPVGSPRGHLPSKVCVVAKLDDIAARLEDAPFWGLEMDPTYRVVAATFDDRLTQSAGRPSRIQLLLFPASVVLASLRSAGQLLTFTAEQLVDISAVFGGCVPTSPIFGNPEPRPGSWAPTWSLEGRSHAPDGRRHTATFRLAADDDQLDVFVRFDDAELRDEQATQLMSTSPGSTSPGAGPYSS